MNNHQTTQRVWTAVFCLTAALACLGDVGTVAADMRAALPAACGRMAFAASTGGGCGQGEGGRPPCPDDEDDVSDILGDMNGDFCPLGPAFHVNIATGNVWTQVPIFKSYCGDREFSLTFTYNSLLSTPDNSRNPASQEGPCALGLGWSGTFDAYYFALDPIYESWPCQGSSPPGEPCLMRPFRIVVVDGDGRQNVYSFQENNSLIGFPPGTRQAVLIKLPQSDEESFFLRYPNGDEWYFYRSNQRVSRIVWANGTTRTFTYDGPNHPRRLAQVSEGARIASFQYDTNGRLSRIIHPDDPNVYTELTYDQQTCDLVSITDPEGDSTSFVYEQPPSTPVPIEIIINPDGPNPQPTVYYMRRIVQETLKNGVVYNCDYSDYTDAQNNVFNARKIIVQKPLEGSGHDDETVLEIRCPVFPRHQRERPPTGAHETVTLIDGRSQTWNYIRNQWGQIVDRHFETTTTYTTTAEYYDAHSLDTTSPWFGRIEELVEPTDLTRNYIWKSHGRLSEVRVQGPGNIDYTTKYRYFDDTDAVGPGEPPLVGNHYETLLGLLLKKIQPDGGVWLYRYDDHSNVTLIRDPQGHDTTFEYTYFTVGTVSTMTAIDRRGYKTISYYDASGNVITRKVYLDPGETATQFLMTVYEYDDAGRKTKEIIHRDETTTLVTKFDYDHMGRLVTEIENYVEGEPETTEQNLTTHYEYDGHGLVTRVTNPRGVKTQYVYNYRNQLTEVIEDEDGEHLVTTYVRDENDNPLEVTSPGSGPEPRLTTYDLYDPLDKVLEMTDAEDFKTKYERDAAGNIKKITRQLTNGASPTEQIIEERTYDAMGRVLYRHVHGETPVSYSYNHPVGSSGCGCGGAGSSIPFKITSQTSTPGVTYQHLDSLGRIHKVVRKAATNDPNEEDEEPGDSVTTNEYDNEGNLVARLGPEGEYAEFVYDGAGRRTTQTIFTGDSQDLTTTYTYNGVDNVTAVTKPNGHMVNYEYDPADRLKRVYDSEGDIAQTSYDENGNIVSRKNGLGKEWSYTFDSLDRVTVVRDPIIESWESGDRITTYQYDDVGNLIDVKNRNDVRTHYLYDEIDRLTAVIEDYNGETITPCAGAGMQALDGEGENGNQGHEIIEIGDPTSQPTSQPTTQPSGGPGESSLDTMNTMTIYQYNGRYLTAIWDPDCNKTEYLNEYNGYGGWQQTITYPNGKTSSLGYWPSDPAIQRHDPRGQWTLFHFDNFNRLVERSVTGGRNDYYTYDRSGRLTGALADTDGNPSTPAGGIELSWSRTYDLAGRPTSEVQQFNLAPSTADYETTITYLLDTSAYTLTQEICYPSCGTRTVNRTWDARGRLVSANAGTDIGVDWTYDDADRRETATRRHSGLKTSTFDYDDNDRLTALAHLTGPTVSNPTPTFDLRYGYDEEGNRQWTEHRSPGLENRSEVYGHDDRSRLTVMERGDLTFDSAGGAAVQTGDELVHGKLATEQNWVKLDRRGNWEEFRDLHKPDTSTEIGRRETRVANEVNEYTSIDLNDTSPEPPPSPDPAPPVTPKYDDAGNLLFDPLAKVAMNPCDPYGMPGGQTVTKDCRLNPNTPNSGCDSARSGCGRGQEYEYDAENRLTRILRDTNNEWKGYSGAAETGKLMEFVYDALGRRVQTTEYVDASSGNTLSSPRITHHVYFGLETIQEYSCGAGWPCSTSMPLVKEYLWGDPKRFPEPIAYIKHNPDTQQEWAYHYLHDILGSVIGLVDNVGTLVERYTYDPYGKVFVETWDPTANENEGAWEPTFEANSDLPYSIYGNPWMWTGYRYDAAVGKYQSPTRIYDPIGGRFLQQDPIGYAGGSINLYEYVLSSPLSWIDPFGLDPMPPSDSTPTVPAPPPVGGGVWIPPSPTPPDYEARIFPKTIPIDRPTTPTIVVIGEMVWSCMKTTTGLAMLCVSVVLTPTELGHNDGVPPPQPPVGPPPGDCSREEFRKLQKEVGKACKGLPRTCRGITDPKEAAIRMERNARCAAARDEINNRCFRGGNQMHRDLAKRARELQDECRKTAEGCTK